MHTHQTRIKRYVQTIPTRLTTTEEIEKRYLRAAKTESVSGEICKYTGALIAVIGAPLALLLNLSPVGISAAFGVFSGGASIAALGSNASSNKKAARLAEITAWKSLQ